jgi:hypothetical protein
MAATALALPAADPLYDSARRKLDSIESFQAKPGSVISFTPAEIMAWARVEVPKIVPEGIRDMRVELGTGTAAGLARVDLLKMRQKKGQDTNWLITKLIEGERPIRVAVQVRSSGGQCTVELTRVEVSNVAASGTVLDFLVSTFFLPLFPDAKINEPFDLDYNIERIEIRPAAVRVMIKR